MDQAPVLRNYLVKVNVLDTSQKNRPNKDVDVPVEAYSASEAQAKAIDLAQIAGGPQAAVRARSVTAGDPVSLPDPHTSADTSSNPEVSAATNGEGSTDDGDENEDEDLDDLDDEDDDGDDPDEGIEPLNVEAAAPAPKARARKATAKTGGKKGKSKK